MTKLLSLHNVSFVTKEKKILCDVSLDLYLSQITGLLGLNGAGKSTLMQIAAGIVIPSEGSVEKKTKITIGYVPDEPPLQPSLSVIDYLVQSLNLSANITQKASKDLLFFILEALGLLPVMQSKIKTLSKGNKQRVAIAQALLPLPDVLLLDEPTIALDPLQLSAFRQLIRQVKSNISVLFSTHLMQEVNELCDKIIVIDQGKIINHKQAEVTNKRYLIRLMGDDLAWVNEEHTLLSHENNSDYLFAFNNQESLDKLVAKCVARKVSITAIEPSDLVLEKDLLQQINQEIGS